MARTADKNSKRQRIFARLDTLSHLKRKAAAVVIVDEFEVSTSYAMTLYQNHRQIRSSEKVGDGFVTIFKVRDTRSNSPVDPYLSNMVKNNPSNDEHRNKQDAVDAYRKNNTRKNKLALDL